MKSALMTLAFAAGALTALAQPTITSVTNAASYTPNGLPNSGITQGGMFVIKGSNLGPATYDVASSFPLTTTRSGTSVSVTVGGQTSSAIIYYAGAAQVAAILRSATPVGTGTLTVTANGQTSAAFAITVVRGALGIFTVSQSGSGDAIATLGNALVSPTNSANPGDTVALWGTGLGAITGDETQAAQQTDLTGIPVQAFVGGKSANVVFRGRNACCTSVDTIYVTIPAGVSGCATPVAFVINGVVSNTTSIPVAASGRICTPTQPGITSGDFSSFLNGGTFSFGGISLSRTSATTPAIVFMGQTISPASTTKIDSGGATFIKYTLQPGGLGTSGQFDIASYGSCTVSVFASGPGVTPPVPNFQFLDAGAAITVNGPGGTKTMTKSTVGGFQSYSATLDQNGNYLNAGQYTISGPGGADVGAFNVSATLAQPLSWINQTTVSSSPINRSSGVTVTWSGGDPAGYTQITGSSSATLPGNAIAAATFICTARTSDGTFTVPSVVLLALPASTTAGGGGLSIPTGSLSVNAYSAIKTFTATGLQIGTLTTFASNSALVTYQ